MKIVISPAKSLNFETELPSNFYTNCKFLKESKQIHAVLKSKSPTDLATLMDISTTLSELNWQRNQIWKTPFNAQNARPAIFAFDGDVYTGIDPYTFTEQQLNVLQQKTRILSGLYGILKPLDLIQPYRLEMGTKLPIGDSKNLYDFWKSTVTSSLNNELKKGEIFINLASHEYFSVIDSKMLKANIITPEFRDYKNGQLKIISFFAKKARGLMVRYIIENDVETIEGLKNFNYENYQFDAHLSKENQLVFTR